MTTKQQTANKYPGKCACGVSVAAMRGTIAKVRGKWVVTCATCNTPKPEREMLGVLYWPNGEGETACTLEYEEQFQIKEDAQRARDEAMEDGRDYGAEYEAYERAASKLCQMQMDGHLGESTRYAQPNAMCALLGGGRVRADGSIVVQP